MQLRGQSLFTIKNDVIDEPNVTYKDRGKDQRFLISNLFNRLQRVTCCNCNVVHTCNACFIQPVFHHFSELCGISLTLLERRLRLSTGVNDRRRLLPLLR